MEVLQTQNKVSSKADEKRYSKYHIHHCRLWQQLLRLVAVATYLIPGGAVYDSSSK